MDYATYGKKELKDLLDIERKNFKKLQKKGNPVDMTRGRPQKAQLEVAMPMLQHAGEYNYSAETADARNYGGLGGTNAAKELFADVLDVKPEEVMVFDGSSLEVMYDLIQFAMQFGIQGETPWNKLPVVKFICPAPGYDRHFAICQAFGIEMITVRMTEEGPDMDTIENLIHDDESIKGMWCVPKYSNPTGITFSDKVVDRMANLKPAAKDFRIIWDNAYAVHDLYENGDKLKNIIAVARKAGTLSRIYEMFSTSKITFAGSGVAGLVTSPENIEEIKKRMTVKTIGPNKVNQVMHVNFLKNANEIKKIMAVHASLLRPKFELFDKKMTEVFDGDEYVNWSKPRGGYFISLDIKGCAKRIIEICAGAGIKLTPAGSTYPYKLDDLDSNIRIAPSVPSLEEMDFAIDILISAIKQARMEYVLKKIYGEIA